MISKQETVISSTTNSMLPHLKRQTQKKWTSGICQDKVGLSFNILSYRNVCEKF